MTFIDEHDVELLVYFLDRAKAPGLDVERSESAIDAYKRLRRANIYGIHELRAALRESVESS